MLRLLRLSRGVLLLLRERERLRLSRFLLADEDLLRVLCDAFAGEICLQLLDRARDAISFSYFNVSVFFGVEESLDKDRLRPLVEPCTLPVEALLDVLIDCFTSGFITLPVQILLDL